MTPFYLFLEHRSDKNSIACHKAGVRGDKKCSDKFEIMFLAFENVIRLTMSWFRIHSQLISMSVLSSSVLRAL